MALRNNGRFRRFCRTPFRRLRMGVWLLILCVLGMLLYVNRVGLPGFVKTPLLEKLRARGLDLQFTRLRWRWDHGIVAENVHFGRTDDPASPKLAVQEVQLRLSYRALATLQIQVDSLVLRQGRLTWPLIDTNAPAREFSVDGIQTQLRLLPGDLWILDHFQAHLDGAKIHFAVIITNASALPGWKIFRAQPRTPAGALEKRLRPLVDALDQIGFTPPSRLNVDVRGDARDWHSFSVQANLNVPGANTPWGTVGRSEFSLRLVPATNGELSRADMALRSDNAQTPWAATTNLTATLRLVSTRRDLSVVSADLGLAAERVETRWGFTTNTHFSAQWLGSATNTLPLSGRAELRLDGAETKWGSAKALQLAGNFGSLTNRTPSVDPSWVWWTNLAPYSSDWECRLAGLRLPELKADELVCRGLWRAPDLQATQVFARLYDGTLDARARLNVASRQFNFSGSSDFDPQGIAAVLTPKSQHWLSQFSWRTPPELEAEGALVLPAWTNRHPDWRGEVKPTVAVLGHLRIGNGTFRSVPASSAESHFTYSNEVWRLPDLTVTRPEGRLHLVHEADERTRDYYFHIHSTIDLLALRPLLEPRQQHGLDLVGFSQPPVIDGDVWGRWYDLDRIGVKASVAATNFTFRGESADGFQTALEYTNRVLKLIELRLQRDDGTQHLAAAGVTVDFDAQRVCLTNGVSTADPLAVARAIGPHIGRAFEPYRFLQPPLVLVEGIIPFHDSRRGDLHFDARGTSFEWWKLKVPRISGKVDWVNDRLILTNIQADFYHGAGAGNAEFIFRSAPGTQFHFNAAVTGADLHLLMSDLSSNTNRLEGRLNGRLDITDAETGDPQSCQGRGRVHLRDGLIWDIPLFGILSPVLDGIAPGLGSSRANEGTATFVITNGIVVSDDLEIRSSILRLQYRGSVDLKGEVNARAQAELLRDTWVVGRVLSVALWPVSKLFEYEITGTLHEPKSEPVFFVPKVVLLPFHMLRALKEPVPEQTILTETNAPPSASP